MKEVNVAFRYELLDVWNPALEYTDACFIVADGLPQRVQFSIGEQLRRAATSIITNIAEGSGKSTPRSERNFYDIAHGSVAETVALFALCLRRNYVNEDRHLRLYNRADRISAMLWGLMKVNNDKRVADEQGQYMTSKPFFADDLAVFFESLSDAHDARIPAAASRVPLPASAKGGES